MKMSRFIHLTDIKTKRIMRRRYDIVAGADHNRHKDTDEELPGSVVYFLDGQQEVWVSEEPDAVERDVNKHFDQFDPPEGPE